jgi:hypothetical protein
MAVRITTEARIAEANRLNELFYSSWPSDIVSLPTHARDALTRTPFYPIPALTYIEYGTHRSLVPHHVLVHLFTIWSRWIDNTTIIALTEIERDQVIMNNTTSRLYLEPRIVDDDQRSDRHGPLLLPPPPLRHQFIPTTNERKRERQIEPVHNTRTSRLNATTSRPVRVIVHEPSVVVLNPKTRLRQLSHGYYGHTGLSPIPDTPPPELDSE